LLSIVGPGKSCCGNGIWVDPAEAFSRLIQTPRQPMQYRMPERIIQTGKHVGQPLRNRAVMSNIRLLNPDYEYLFFDEERVRE
jgi:hypothetical protein